MLSIDGGAPAWKWPISATPTLRLLTEQLEQDPEPLRNNVEILGGITPSRKKMTLKVHSLECLSLSPRLLCAGISKKNAFFSLPFACSSETTQLHKELPDSC